MVYGIYATWTENMDFLVQVCKDRVPVCETVMLVPNDRNTIDDEISRQVARDLKSLIARAIDEHGVPEECHDALLMVAADACLRMLNWSWRGVMWVAWMGGL